MLPLAYVVENLGEVQENCRRRNVEVDLSGVPALAERRSRLHTDMDNLRARQNELAKLGKDPAQRGTIKEKAAALKAESREIEQALADVEDEIHALLERAPNLSHPDAPVGVGEDDNAVVETVGTPRELGFKAKDHVELGEALDLIDFDAGARVTGANFYFLKNEAVLLELGLLRYAMDILRANGFTPHSTPDLAMSRVLSGTGYSPRGNETQIYSIAGQDLCLIATAEIPLGGLLADQIVSDEILPLKLAGISHCFRTEAGAHGRAARGLYRVHQFSKAEMFIFCTPEQSAAMLDEMVRMEKEIFTGLEIPFRIVDCCTGDLGGPAYRKFDLEAWMPGRGEHGEYGEITSASNCTDYQARRLKARFKRKDGGKPQMLHTLNGTGLAVSRALLALLENHQQADGSITIPAKLVPYVGFDAIRR